MSSTVEARPGSIGNRTVISAGWLVAWRLMTRALGLVSTLLLARILVPADFGLIAMATTFSHLIGALSELGVGDALIRRQENERGHYDTAFTMQAIRGALTGAVIAAGAWGASDWFNEPRLLPVMFVLAALAVAGGSKTSASSSSAARSASTWSSGCCSCHASPGSAQRLPWPGCCGAFGRC